MHLRRAGHVVARPLNCGVMRHSPAQRAGLKRLVVALCGVWFVHGADAQGFCEQLSRFARNLGTSESREITLFTEWSAEPTVACRHRREDAISVEFCDWLIKNSAIEYMEINVWKVFSCATGVPSGSFTVGKSLSGTTRFEGVRLSQSLVDVEIEYSVRDRLKPDMLLIRLTNQEQ
jgi:hypothetical protein